MIRCESHVRVEFFEAFSPLRALKHMPISPPTWLKHTLAGLIFAMAFLLTPRAWVDEPQRQDQAQIPVQWLQGSEQQDDCLWCTPALTPVDCDRQDPGQSKRLWLNPDAPVPEQESQPCLEATEPEQEPHA